MKFINFILITLIILLVIVSLRLYQDNLEMRRAHPATSDFAVQPDIYIENAQRDLNRHFYKTSQKDIAKAIKSMRLLENDLDSISKLAVENAIEDLEIVELQIQTNQTDQELINKVFSNTLNSLAYVQLRVSEQLAEDGATEEARYALKYAIEHLKNAMRFSDEEKQKVEREVYLTIDSIIDNDLLLENELRSTVDALLLEMDTTVLKTLKQ